MSYHFFNGGGGSAPPKVGFQTSSRHGYGMKRRATALPEAPSAPPPHPPDPISLPPSIHLSLPLSISLPQSLSLSPSPHPARPYLFPSLLIVFALRYLHVTPARSERHRPTATRQKGFVSHHIPFPITLSRLPPQVKQNKQTTTSQPPLTRAMT